MFRKPLVVLLVALLAAPVVAATAPAADGATALGPADPASVGSGAASIDRPGAASVGGSVGVPPGGSTATLAGGQVGVPGEGSTVASRAGAASALVEPPQFEAVVPDPTLTPGATQPLQFQLVNDAEDPNVRVRNATSVEVDVRDRGPIDVESGTLLAGRLTEGVPQTLTARVSVDADAAPGVYDLPAAVRYEYRTGDGLVSDRQTVELRVRVERRARFEVTDTESSVPVGGSGELSVTVENTGSATAESASLSLQTTSPAVAFGSSGASSQFVGDWDPGERRTLTFDVVAAPDAESRPYTIRGTVDYEADGVPRQAPIRLGLTPGAARTFALRDVRATLEVGERGTLRGTVENTGDRTVEDAVVVLSGTPATVTPVEPEYAVGDLGPGERADFDLTAVVSPDGEPGPRQFELRVRYAGEDGAARASDPLDARVTVAPEQSFAVDDVRGDLQVGNRGTIRGRVRNTGDRTVENAVVVLAGTPATATPVEPEYPVGNLSPGEAADFSVEVLPSPEGTAGPRQFDLRVRYDGADGSPRASDPQTVRVEVAPEQSFAVRNVSSTLRVGERGTLRGTVENTGPRTVREAVVVFRPSSPLLTPVETESAVGTLAPGETARFAFETSVAGRAVAGPRAVDLQVRYRNDDGDRRTSDVLQTVAVVGAEQSFAVRGVESTLRVGAEGTVSGRLVNTGNRTLENVVVRFPAEPRTLSPVESEYAVGSLAPGEAAEFTFDVAVTDAAGAGPRQLSFRAEYRSTEGEARTSDPLDARVEVGGRRDTFAVEPVAATVPAGGSGQLRVRVTNADDEPVTDVAAKVFPDAPLSSADDEAFVERLEPGESTVLAFELSVGGSALANKTYPLSIDFRYDDADGDSRISDTYEVPVTTTGGAGGGGPSLVVVGAVAVLVVVVLGGGLAVVRRG